MAGERGFSAFTFAEGGERYFLVQHRSLDPGAPVPVIEQTVTLVSDLRLNYCPWCGVNLRDFYQGRLADFDRTDLRAS